MKIAARGRDRLSTGKKRATLTPLRLTLFAAPARTGLSPREKRAVLIFTPRIGAHGHGEPARTARPEDVRGPARSRRRSSTARSESEITREVPDVEVPRRSETRRRRRRVPPTSGEAHTHTDSPLIPGARPRFTRGPHVKPHFNTRIRAHIVPANCFRSSSADCGSDINKSSVK